VVQDKETWDRDKERGGGVATPLLEFLKAAREAVLKMDIEEIVRLAGKKLITDESEAFSEFRQFLSGVEGDKLSEYATYCLDNSFHYCPVKIA
jgi:hypothetical protein